MNNTLENKEQKAPTIEQKIAAMLMHANAAIHTSPELPEGGEEINAAAAVKAAVAKKIERRKPPFAILGETRGGSAFVMYSVRTGKIDELKLSDLRGDKLLTRAPLEEIAWWTHPQEMEVDPAWAEKHETGVLAAARRMLLEMVREASVYNPDRVRRNGIWQEVIGGDAGVVCNTGEGCYFLRYADGKLQEVSNNLENHLYSKEKATPAPVTTSLLPNEVLTLAGFLAERPWEMEGRLCGMLLVGWLVNSILAGVVRRRPHLWVTGPAATGKTTLHDDILSILGFRDGEGNGLGVILEGATSTEAGTRQEINSRALPVVFDELENTKAYNIDKNIEGILNLMRTAYSSRTGIISKGGEDGNARDYMIRCGFLCFSVHSKLDRGTDYGRCLELRMLQLPDSKKKEIWARQEEGRAMIGNGNFTGRLLFTVMYKTQAIKRFEAELESHLKGVTEDARKAELFAHLLAGYYALAREGGELEEGDLEEAAECVYAYAETEEVSSEFEQCLETLLSHTEYISPQRRSVRQLCKLVKDGDSDIRKLAIAQLDTLGMGWAYHKSKMCLQVRYQEKTINTRIFGGTPWDGKLRRVLGTGCEEDGKPNEYGIMLSSARRGKKTVKALFLPEELILPGEDEAGEG